MSCLGALALLSACADDPQPKAIATQSRHVSPPAVPAPVLPEGTFDQDRARQSLGAAQAARQAGQLPEARRQAEAAVDAWPADPGAWQALAEICQAGGDQACRRQADFFKAKVDYANTLPTRAAVLGFQTIAEEPDGTAGSGITYDRKSHDSAARLWAFYNAQDSLKNRRDMPDSEGPSFSERYPYAPAILVIGVVAGVLTEANSLAGK
ncbi:tetratricopeptide repeat protein [Telmatospirillum siberiense]|uniref:Uncharacterized protein n=1 Tax=Telmatospirillum siberiense TaxID=382514 RepID=A0A2N3PSY9_9PROT|nr:tetratricopeptide repeat protein [Telmatospirillum siberiense]PKU23519.1 hypothetical protein CWS72_15725 [Telmatospirillum siberiense]